MTQKLYLGSSLTPALGARDVAQLMAGVAQIHQNVIDTNFDAPAAAIAKEADTELADRIGLQEVSNWCVRRQTAPAVCDKTAGNDGG
jgi:hypothetical protein